MFYKYKYAGMYRLTMDYKFNFFKLSEILGGRRVVYWFSFVDLFIDKQVKYLPKKYYKERNLKFVF